MKRVVIFAAFGGITYLIVRARLPKLHEQFAAHCQTMKEHCQGMFEQTAPGKAGGSPCSGEPSVGSAQGNPCSGEQTTEQAHDAA